MTPYEAALKMSRALKALKIPHRINDPGYYERARYIRVWTHEKDGVREVQVGGGVDSAFGKEPNPWHCAIEYDVQEDRFV